MQVRQRGIGHRLLLSLASWQLAGLMVWLVFELLRLHTNPAYAALAGPVSWLLLMVPVATFVITWRGVRVTPWPLRLMNAITSALLSGVVLLLLILLIGTPVHLALGGLL